MIRPLNIITAFLMIFIFGCEEKNYVIDDPVILASEVESISNDGVVIKVTVGHLEFNDIIDHGVVWARATPSPQNQLILDTDFAVQGGKLTSTEFEATIRAELLDQKSYYLRAFIKTANKTIYGKVLYFKSQGSVGPIIENIWPLRVNSSSEKITIRGKRFLSNLGKKQVESQHPPVIFRTRDGSEYVAAVVSVNDSVIVTTVNAPASSMKVVIKKPENREVVSSDWITKAPPTITAVISPAICSDIIFKGQGVLNYGKPDNIHVNGLEVSRYEITDSTITISSVFHDSRTLDASFSFRDSQITKTFDDPAQFPVVTNEQPDVEPDSRIYVFQGNNFTLCEGLTATIGGYDEEIVETTPTSITVKGTHSLCSEFNATLSYNHRISLYVSEAISPIPPTVTSINPLSGPPGTLVTIQGSNLIDAKVRFGNSDEFEIVSNNGTELVAKVPVPGDLGNLYFDSNGNTPLVVYKCRELKNVPFDLPLPVVTLTDVAPRVSDGTESLVITGTNFLADPKLTVYLTNGYSFWSLYILHRTDTQLTVRAPADYLGSRTGTFHVGVHQFGIRYEVPGTIVIN